MASRLTDRRFLWPDHVDLLSRKLVDVAMGRCSKLLVFEPPRHGKSTQCSLWFPTWYFDWFPQKRVLLGSYGSDYAATWGRKVRNTITEHAELLRVRLAADSQAANEWNTTAGGGMVTNGVDGSWTGRGGDLLLIDDPIKNKEEAYSARQRQKVWDWWEAVAHTRLEPGGSAVVTLTRWHEDDLAGRIIANDKFREWEIIRLPALAEPNDPLGRAEGEALWPARYSRQKLENIRATSSSWVWDSLYQQKPPKQSASGAYYNYDDSVHMDPDVKLIDELPLQLSVDFNRRPGMHGVIGQDLNKDDLLTARHVLHEPGMTIESMVVALDRLIKERYGHFRWHHLELFGDATGSTTQMGDGRSYWQVLQAALRAKGMLYQSRYARRNPGVKDRVAAFNNALRSSDGCVHYKVHPECTPLINDLRRVKWDGDDLDKSDQDLTHPSDADGYRVAYLRPIRIPGASANVDDLRVTAI